MGLAKLLLVDDDPLIREMIEYVLVEAGYDVDSAENGVDALRKLQKDQDISLIISDMNMPEMGGIELVKRLQEESIDVPVLILTGEEEGPEATKGVTGFLVKDDGVTDSIVEAVARIVMCGDE